VRFGVPAGESARAAERRKPMNPIVEASSRSGRTWPRALLAALAAGLVLRLLHYLRGPALWHDEAALILNVLGKSFAELLGPLCYAEAGPPLFLWLERAGALLFGDGLGVLRFLPCAAGCVALVCVTVVARRLLPSGAAVVLVLLFACSDRLLWHGCEAKPYAVDVLVAAGLLLLLVRTDDRNLDRTLLLLAVVAPPLVFLSYPTC